ncbi:MAG: 4Fe-4S dicluster domain-containing protein [Planctomycetota bacterium]
MTRYGMVIDLKRCYGCFACVMACKAKNHTPPGVFWARLLKGETGEYPNTVRQALPVLCFQCEEPSCLTVCPTGATVQHEDGIVTVDKEKCIGCNYCKMACPYGARYMVEEYKSYFPEGVPGNGIRGVRQAALGGEVGLRRLHEVRLLQGPAGRRRPSFVRQGLPGQREDLRGPGRSLL